MQIWASIDWFLHYDYVNSLFKFNVNDDKTIRGDSDCDCVMSVRVFYSDLFSYLFISFSSFTMIWNEFVNLGSREHKNMIFYST